MVLLWRRQRQENTRTACILLIYVLILHCKREDVCTILILKAVPKLILKKEMKSYNAYVKNVTPKGSCVAKCFKAFIVGGCICVAGQIILNVCKWMKVPDTDAASYTTLILVFLSVILTGLNIYPSITTFGGAGSLVPITGFANSVAAPAIEYKKEVGCSVLAARYSRLPIMLFYMEYFLAGVQDLYIWL